MWHITRYSMVLWGYPPHEAETTLPKVIQLLNQFSRQSLTWHLSHQPDRLIPTSLEQWADLARESRERRNFGELDLFIESPSGLSTSLSVDAPAFVRDFDVLDIGLDTQHVAGAQAMFDFESLYALFTESTRLFRPFWARVRDLDQIITDRIGNLHLSVDLTKVPDTIHWLNFFDERMVERLGGKEKLLAAPAYEVREWADPPGILLVLQREPFDYHAPEHRRRQEEIVKYLELEWLHTLYPKKGEVHSAGQWVSRR